MFLLWDQEELFIVDEKNQHSKISWHCPLQIQFFLKILIEKKFNFLCIEKYSTVLRRAKGWLFVRYRDEFQRLRQRNRALNSDLEGAEQRARDLQRQIGALQNAAAQADLEMDRLRGGPTHQVYKK